MSSRKWGSASCNAQQNSHQEHWSQMSIVLVETSKILTAPCLFHSSCWAPRMHSEVESHFSQGAQNLVGKTTTHWNNYHSMRLDCSPGDKLWSMRTLGPKVFSTLTSSGLNGELQHWPCSTSYCRDCCQSALTTAAKISSIELESHTDGRLERHGSRAWPSFIRFPFCSLQKAMLRPTRGQVDKGITSITAHLPTLHRHGLILWIQPGSMKNICKTKTKKSHFHFIEHWTHLGFFLIITAYKIQQWFLYCSYILLDNRCNIEMV